MMRTCLLLSPFALDGLLSAGDLRLAQEVNLIGSRHSLSWYRSFALAAYMSCPLTFPRTSGQCLRVVLHGDPRLTPAIDLFASISRKSTSSSAV
ncbi:hypothetical protein IWX50DRAFT_626825 [Phyllosticta citricarpa]|uniref:Secreted protein n=1 Tax=Phyllosticta citricarpa TaxID=55181 RepID=A0ABR1LPT9_9PEZI